MDVHSGLVQGASPNNQNSLSDMAVNDTGSKPVGTVPPDEPLGAVLEVVDDVDVDVEELVGVEELVEVDELVVVVLVALAGATVVVEADVVEVLAELASGVFWVVPPQAVQAKTRAVVAAGTIKSRLFLTMLVTLGQPPPVPGRPAPDRTTHRSAHL